jgi:hypothetical protein
MHGPGLGNDFLSSSTAPTLLLAMSRRTKSTDRTLQGATVSPAQPMQPSPPAERPPGSPPDPRLHSAVCCCLLCEQAATGEQAMRSVGGDYGRFLTQIGASLPSSALQSTAASNLPATLQPLPHSTHRPSSTERR